MDIPPDSIMEAGSRVPDVLGKIYSMSF